MGTEERLFQSQSAKMLTSPKLSACKKKIKAWTSGRHEETLPKFARVTFGIDYNITTQGPSLLGSTDHTISRTQTIVAT